MTYSNLEELKRKNAIANIHNIAKAYGLYCKTEDHADWLDVHFSCRGFNKHMRIPWDIIGVDYYNKIDNDLQKARERMIKDVLDKIEAVVTDKYGFKFEPRSMTTDCIIFEVSDNISHYKEVFKFQTGFPLKTWLDYLDRTLYDVAEDGKRMPGCDMDDVVSYCAADVAATHDLYASFISRAKQPSIKDVIFSGPATIVLWQDGTKTIVKAQNGETVDKEKGLAMAIVKRVYGNKGNYNDIFRKYIDE